MIPKILSFAETILLALQSGLAFLTGYLLLLTAASRHAPRNTNSVEEDPTCQFLIIIPAHNEERLLGETLASLARLNYPPSLYTVHVIADNCTDRTAEIASEKGAVVHVRNNQELVGKGYALQWLLDQIWKENLPHDALVFFDADSLVSENFLQVMAARLARGETAIQAYYATRAPEKSWNGALRYAALAVIHYLRPQGRMVLGGSAGLKGNGMVFTADVMRRYAWSASLTEDIELHMAMVLAGERVTFAPDAVVWGEMPDTLTSMRSQHMRWERGRLQMARTYIPTLLKSSIQEMKSGQKQRSFLLFDAAMEHIIPPFSVLAGLSGLGLMAGLTINGIRNASKTKKTFPQPRRSGNLDKVNLVIGFAILIGQMVYLISGLRQVQAPRFIYIKLLYAPILIVWKLKQYGEAILGRAQLGWVRTARNGGQDAGK
jgi:cellulose synthase/poly-beta-1,6-N-acetylglucosamine synthase-like glycosyltransferase